MRPWNLPREVRRIAVMLLPPAVASVIGCGSAGDADPLYPVLPGTVRATVHDTEAVGVAFPSGGRTVGLPDARRVCEGRVPAQDGQAGGQCTVFGSMAPSRYALLKGWPERLMALVVITVVAACGQSGSGGTEGPGDIDIPDRAIGLFPADWVEYRILDVGRILDENGAAHADEFEDSWGNRLDEGGILIDDVDILAEATGQEAEHVMVLQGDIDFEAVRDELFDSGMEEGEYRGFELWEGDEYPLASEVVLIEDGGFVLLGGGDARTVLRGLSREVGLLEYEDGSGVHELLNSVGDGWHVQVWTGGDCLNAGLQRCEGVAWSVTPAGRGDYAEITWAFAFRDERSADMELEDVEEVFDDIDALDVDGLEQDGRLIVVTGILEDHDWRQDGRAWASVNFAGSAAAALPTPPRALPVAPAPAWPAAPVPTRAPAPAPAPAMPAPAPAPAATTAPAPVPAPALPSIDRDALIALYHSAGGENWVRRDGWLSDRHMGTWFGVTVNTDGRISELVMPENGLTGELPPEIGTLAELVNLSLHHNSLEGEIPSELADLTELNTLNLGGSRLSGDIPAWLGDLADLETLNLSQNQLTGEIPSELADLPRLRWLALSGNRFNGCIPAGLRSVERIDLHEVGLPYC